VAVTDNSLEQAISALRRALGRASDPQPYIWNVPRQGYRFSAAVTRSVPRASDSALDALLAPHRAWIEGRAALESFERDQIPVHSRERVNRPGRSVHRFSRARVLGFRFAGSWTCTGSQVVRGFAGSNPSTYEPENPSTGTRAPKHPRTREPTPYSDLFSGSLRTSCSLCAQDGFMEVCDA
jgi:hypothetical protein